MAQTVESVPESSRPQLSLRERKFARTKHALLRAAIERLRTKRLDEIPVKELCEQVEVSEATFFNYFPKKEDLLRYFFQIWVIELNWHARNSTGKEAGLDFVESIFDYAAAQLSDHPRLMMEIIAYMAQQPAPARCPIERGHSELTIAERLQALPECNGVECVPELCLGDLFRHPLELARSRGELAASADIDAAVLALLSIFFGVPLWLGLDQPERLGPAYRRQLRLLWAGVRAAGSS
jgi:AcrR family transcriptional regulator